jgi:uncharacterized protein (DUF1778 family)
VPKKTPTRSPAPQRRKAVRKELTIHLRVTAEQKETLAAAAERDGQGLSSWLLAAGLRAARVST